MKITMVHISDLHYRTGWEEAVGPVWRAFTEDMKEQTKEEDPYLVISGDLVWSGGDRSQYEELARRISDDMGEGIPRGRRICVPGNHDAASAAMTTKGILQKGALTEIGDEKSFNDRMPDLSEMFFEEKFENYKEAEEDIAHFRCCDKNLGGGGWEIGNVGIYCLNTALCTFAHCKDQRGEVIGDRNRLMIDTRSLYKWVAGSRADFKVLVMHHPEGWLEDWAEDELQAIIDRDFDLVLCGHIHSARAELVTTTNSGAIRSVAPALFTHKEETLGYSIIRVDTETGKVAIGYRQWSGARKFIRGTGLAGNDSGEFRARMGRKTQESRKRERPGRGRRDGGNSRTRTTRKYGVIPIKSHTMGETRSSGPRRNRPETI